MWVAETGVAEPPVTNEEPVIIDVPVDADLVEVGQILHSGSRVPGRAGLGCDFDGFTGYIVLTVHPGQGGSEITIAVNDNCQLIVESLRKTRPIDESGATAAQQSEWRWEAWEYHRLRGKYDAGNGERDIQSVTEVEFHLRETSTGFKFDTQSPRADCQDMLYYITGSGGCRLSYVNNTSSRKHLKASGRFNFWGTPQTSWDQSAADDAKTSGIDRVICYSDSSRPDFLKRTCRGDRDPQ